jgi:ribosomal protein L10
MPDRRRTIRDRRNSKYRSNRNTILRHARTDTGQDRLRNLLSTRFAPTAGSACFYAVTGRRN